MKIIVNGALGRMGSEIIRLINERSDMTVVAAVDIMATGDDMYNSLSGYTGEADIIIDFTQHEATEALLQYATSRKIPLVIATTGQTDDESRMIREASSIIPIFLSANMSVGISLLIRLAKQAASVMKDADIEIIEKHHSKKLDAPSGTALMIAKNICEVRQDAVINTGRNGHEKRYKNEIGISSIRMGNIIGEHEVLVCTDSQTLTLKHEVHNRTLFAEGAIAAAEFLEGKNAGLYTMYDMIK